MPTKINAASRLVQAADKQTQFLDLQISGSPEVTNRLINLLAGMEYNSAVGHSNIHAMWFHGSQTRNLKPSSKLIYLTKSLAVAQAYADGKVVHTGTGGTASVVYEVILKQGIKVFDFKLAAHKEIYTKLRESINPSLDSDDKLPSIKSAGFLQRSGNCGYGIVPALKQFLSKDFDGVYVDEGSQGVSLALFNPHESIAIIKEH